MKQNTSLAKTQTSGVALYAKPESIVLFDKNLTEIKKDFIIASKSPRIYEIEKVNIKLELNDLLENLYVEVGDKSTTNEDKKILLDKAFTDIYRYFPHISIADIATAFHMGVRGEFDQQLFVRHDYTNISVVMLHSWIKNYLAHADRAKVLTSQRDFESHEKAKLQIEEQEKQVRLLHRQIVNDFCMQYTESLKKKKFLVKMLPNFIYFWYPYFTEKKLLIFKKDELNQQWTAARMLAIEEYQRDLKNSLGDVRRISAKQQRIQTLSENFSDAELAYKSETIPEQKQILKEVLIDIKTVRQKLSIVTFLNDCIDRKFDLSKEIMKIENEDVKRIVNKEESSK